MNKPHKHAEVIKAWADGAVIQNRRGALDSWLEVSDPRWLPYHEYRVKPKDKIKKYRYVYEKDGELLVSADRYPAGSLTIGAYARQAIQRIDSTMIEVEE